MTLELRNILVAASDEGAISLEPRAPVLPPGFTIAELDDDRRAENVKGLLEISRSLRQGATARNIVSRKKTKAANARLICSTGEIGYNLIIGTLDANVRSANDTAGPEAGVLGAKRLIAKGGAGVTK